MTPENQKLRDALKAAENIIVSALAPRPASEPQGEENVTEVTEIPLRLDVCPKCGADAAIFVHPAFDGGSYVRCDKCMYSDQAVTWAPTDAQAAQKWNNFCEKGKVK